MDKPTRNQIQKATQDARTLLETEFSEQLEALFDIHSDGTVAPEPGSHLDAARRIIRQKIVAAIAHEKAGGMSDRDAVAAYLREASFTCLNRFVALKMLEARDLTQQCISKGELSSGFKEFCGLAPGLAELSDRGYRLYIESLFDELSTEIRVLFDRLSPASLLWPRKTALDGLLSILNRQELEEIWDEDETIGWVYQYFNSADERKKMRDESAAPRNSHELAVRNQFFTPRYVVEFLTDNTLGRIWYEMTQGQTVLKDTCRYLVRRPDEVFLDDTHSPEDAKAKRWLQGADEDLPAAYELACTVDTYKRHPSVDAAADWLYRNITRVTAGEASELKTQELLDLLFMLHRADHFSEGTLDHYSTEIKRIIDELAERRNQGKSDNQTQEALLNQPAFIPYRKLKDPREILMLDPACGSMHFGLYAFDLFEIIYRESLNPRFGFREKLLSTVGWAGASELTILPSSVKLKDAATAYSDYLGQQISVDDAYVVVASEPDGGDGVRADCPFIVKSETKFRVSLSQRVPLIQFDYEKAVRKGWFSARFGDDFVKNSGCFVYQEPLNDDQAEEQVLTQIPRMIIENNIHGIDIDPRAVQIAALSLWLRAQKSWKNLGTKATLRPRIAKSNVVTAEPMPGEEEMRREFVAKVKPRVIGQLVDVVFEKMKFAGEAGSLLKIEEEIKDAVATAKMQWAEKPKPEQMELFAEMKPATLVQQKLPFDTEEITDESFWEQAEERILDALKIYAKQAENGSTVSRRLFTDDAALGFSFIDLCRKRYDVVLMNPPFGEFSKLHKQYARIFYPNSFNDILGAFVERWLLCLEDGGRLGAITSRTCFYLVSFTDWREKVILAEAALAAVTDLGQGVMDDAMVEAAAYILERSRPTIVIPFIRSIAELNRQSALGSCISAINAAASEPHLFLARQGTFSKLAGSPFVYWANSDDLDRFASLPTFEPEVAEVRQGLATGDDPRFVRAVWEVAERDTQFVYYPTNGEIFCRLDDPIVLAYQQRRKTGDSRWAFHIKAGASQPWHSPITLKIDWHQDGFQLRNFRDTQGKLRSRPQNIVYYYRPGFSWTLRAARFYPYVVPGNCIPSVSRYMAFPKQGVEYDALGVSASRIASAFMRFYGEKFEWPKFLVESLKALPWPKLRDNARQFFRRLIQQEVDQRRRAYMNHEPFQEFLFPIKVKDFSNGGRSLAFDPKTLLGEEGERLVADAYGFDQKAAMRIERDVIEALEYQHGIAVSAANEEGENGEQNTDEGSDFVLDYSERAQIEALLSYFVGCIFGRWDARIAIDPSLAPKLPDPFDPLPVCSPGMLVGPDGLPTESNRIVSEEWLRARPDANALPPEGAVLKTTIADADYPLRISWNGILVDDPGFEGEQLHEDDIVLRCREVMEVLWKDKANDIEQEACEILKIPTLRDYYRKSFFTEHIKRYSKSRRKAPIYWQLSTPSASYSIWLYYHRFTKDTFYRVLNEYVVPKLQFEERELNKIRQQYSINPTAGQRKELASREAFVAELSSFKEDVARIAPLWNPNLNDGVIINFAPLWRLVPQNKPWQKECKQVWDKLVDGEYDWAHLAMHLWPERVVPKCAKDRSLAIAHGLDEVFWQADEKGKSKPKPVSGETVKALVQERTSPTVKAALEDLLKAPAPATMAKKKRKKKA